MIAPLPPPVHGSAMMTQYIKDSKIINDAVNLDWVNLSTSRRMDEIGKKSPAKIWRFISSYFKTFWKLCTHRYDSCYLAITCHGNGFLKDAPFVLLCKLFGNRIIIHQHNKGMSRDVNKSLFRFLFKAVYCNAKVILLSERLYPDISEIVDHSQVVIVPNGIPPVKRLEKKKNEIPRLLFLSNLIESKGIFTLLDTCKILKERGCIFTCSFVGGETKEINREKFESELQKRGLDEYVTYIGPRYGDEKTKEIASSDVLVFPTSNETFGLVLLEAMQQGIPHVSTPVGGIPDIIIDGETGLISQKSNPEKLAGKIKLLIENPSLRDKMGEAAYTRFNQLYTLEKFEEAIKPILTKFNILGRVKYVEYLGPKYGDSKLQELANSDLLVFPTTYSNECFPVVILEAMRQGVPVISTNEGGIADMVEHGKTGFVIDDVTPEKWANTISAILTDNSLRQSCSVNAYDRFYGNFTIQHFEDRILNILTGIG